MNRGRRGDRWARGLGDQGELEVAPHTLAPYGLGKRNRQDPECRLGRGDDAGWPWASGTEVGRGPSASQGRPPPVSDPAAAAPSPECP